MKLSISRSTRARSRSTSRLCCCSQEAYSESIDCQEGFGPSEVPGAAFAASRIVGEAATNPELSGDGVVSAICRRRAGRNRNRTIH